MAAEVDNELLENDQIVAHILKDEMPGLSDEYWNEIYLEVQRDITQFLVRQLIEDRRQDEGVDYELNEMFHELAISQQVELDDPENNDSAVCPICKRNIVRRVQGSRIVCEMQGCLNFNIVFADFRVENIMRKVGQLIKEHKEEAELGKFGCFDESNDIQKDACFSLVMVDKNYVFTTLEGNINADQIDKKGLSLFLLCSKCKFFDFVNLF